MICCAPTVQKFKKYKPQVNTEKIADLCMDGSNDESLKVAATVTFGQQFVDASLSPEGCFEGIKEKQTQLADLDNIVECCVQSVIGEMKEDGRGSGGNAMESIQSARNNDCYSGSCVIHKRKGGSTGGGSTGGQGMKYRYGSTGGGSSLKCFTPKKKMGKISNVFNQKAEQGSNGKMHFKSTYRQENGQSGKILKKVVTPILMHQMCMATAYWLVRQHVWVDRDGNLILIIGVKITIYYG